MARATSLDFISVSSIEDFMQDRLRWCYKWVENRVPRSVPSALTVGKVIHKAFEMHFKNPSITVAGALAMLLPPPGTLLDLKEQKEVDQLRGLVEPLQFWKDEFPITQTLEVEQPFEAYLTSGAKFRGRPDRVVVAYGKVFHMQHKTAGPSIKMDTFLTLASQKYHELLYGRYLKKKYGPKRDENGDIIRDAEGNIVDPGLEYGGSIYNVIRKLKYRSKQITKLEPAGKILHTPSEMLFQSIIPIDLLQVDQAYDEVNALSILMDRTMDMYLTEKLIPRNRKLDGGQHGNSLDLYTLVAMGELSLADDSKFMDREETYETEEVSEEA